MTQQVSSSSHAAAPLDRSIYDVLTPGHIHAPWRLISPSDLIKDFPNKGSLFPKLLSPTSHENSIFSLITFSREQNSYSSLRIYFINSLLEL